MDIVSSNVDGILWAKSCAFSSSALYGFDWGMLAGKQHSVLTVEECDKAIVEDADAADAFSDACERLDFVARVVDADDLFVRRADWCIAREVGHTQNVDHSGERFTPGDCGEGRPFRV